MAITVASTVVSVLATKHANQCLATVLLGVSRAGKSRSAMPLTKVSHP